MHSSKSNSRSIMAAMNSLPIKVGSILLLSHVFRPVVSFVSPVAASEPVEVEDSVFPWQRPRRDWWRRGFLLFVNYLAESSSNSLLLPSAMYQAQYPLQIAAHINGTPILNYVSYNKLGSKQYTMHMQRSHRVDANTMYMPLQQTTQE